MSHCCSLWRFRWVWQVKRRPCCRLKWVWQQSLKIWFSSILLIDLVWNIFIRKNLKSRMHNFNFEPFNFPLSSILRFLNFSFESIGHYYVSLPFFFMWSYISFLMCSYIIQLGVEWGCWFTGFRSLWSRFVTLGLKLYVVCAVKL